MQHLKVSEEGLHLDRNTLDEGRGRGTVCEVVSRLWGSRQGSTQDREGGSPACDWCWQTEQGIWGSALDTVCPGMRPLPRT